MGLITWANKGGRLTSDEMDNNLYYLEKLASDYFTSATESQEINIANSRVQSININSDINFICEDASIGSYKLLLKHYDRANITFGDNIDIEYTKPDYETISYNIIDGFNSSIYAVVKQPDGKILVGGEFTTYRTKSCYNLVRFNIDGSLDETFNSKLDGLIYDIYLLPDGKILVGGTFTTYLSSYSCNSIARLNSNGTIDTTFNIGTGANDNIRKILLIDDKILICGDFSTYNGIVSNNLARLNSDGSFDDTFNVGGTGIDNIEGVRTMRLQDNKIVLGGWFTSYNGNSCNAIVRINQDGAFDDTFNIGTGIQGVPFDITIIEDKIIISGSITTYNDLVCSNIIKLNYDGLISSTYSGVGIDNDVNNIIDLGDGSILACVDGTASYKENTFNGLVRILEDETMDINYDYNINSESRIINIWKMLMIDDNNIMYIDNSYPSILRYNLPTNTLDEGVILDGSFITGSGFTLNTEIRTIAVQSDGKILVGGTFTTYNDVSCNYIVRLNSDRTLDNTFDIGTGFDGGAVNKICIQLDGKILVGGGFTSYDSNLCNYITRLNSDGSFDDTFNIGTGFDSYVFGMIICDDSRIIVSTYGSSYNGNPFVGSVVLNIDGSLYTMIVSDSPIKAFKIQPDGKILVGGTFTTINGYTKNYIARLNSDYSIDNTFDGNIDNVVFSIGLLSNGKIIIVGEFLYHIRILNYDGTFDTTFNIGTGFNNTVNTLSIMDDDKIVVGGSFTTYKDEPQSYLSVLNSDGSLCDTTLKTHRIGMILTTEKIGDKVLIGGGYTTSPYHALSSITIKKDDVLPFYQIVDFMYNGVKLISK